ncbi:hypothetical protein [Mammaliicoccus lentus]|uniref:hypothetical protein n=1 Tax=Mammaliicoccus lentus TaxID=42858 RepID=UPI001B32123C|nr:hypothetical protein [Mammaliicoccus lentus]
MKKTWKEYKVWLVFAFYLSLIKSFVVLCLLSVYVYFNFTGNSVYYAKHISHSEGRYPEVEMLLHNLERVYTPEIKDLDYLNYCVMKLGSCLDYRKIGISETLDDSKETRAVQLDDELNGYEFLYRNNKYNFTENYRIFSYYVDDFTEKPIKGIDEEKIKREMYEVVKPVIDVQPEPFINLQWIFNWWYGNEFKNQ